MAPSKKPKNVNKDQKPLPDKPRRGWWFWLSNGVSAFIWFVLLSVGVLGYFALGLPDVDDVVASTRRQPIVIVRDAQGEDIVRAGALYGDAISVDDMPPALPAAVLAIEDRRFYTHAGLDARGFARAMLANVRAGSVVQGGSTITQQVAKNLFLTPERTIARKIREALLALWLEQKFTKDQILTLYLNRVYLGAGTYGVEAAAQTYFGRTARNLTVYQSAMIAGLMKAPSRYNPKTDEDAARSRTAVVLQAMVAAGYLTPEQANTAKSGGQVKVSKGPSGRGRYFADWVLANLDDLVGSIEDDLIVHTTLDPSVQSAAERSLVSALKGVAKTRDAGQGAVIVLSPNGAVRAMIGGRDYQSSQFNRAVQARRQPGSAFKPFVFLAGLEAGLTPIDTLEDAPINIDGWRPKNFSGTYEGPITVEDALARSINTVAVRVARKAGPSAIISTARRVGISTPLTSDLGLALGTSEVSLIDLTAAYAPFANGGVAIVPFGILDVVTTDGRVLYQRQGGGLGRAAEPEYINMMNRMLVKTMTQGTGKTAQLDRPSAGKTGTSQDYRDAWFIGYTSDLVAGVWIGNDDGSGMKGVTGGGLPARVWRDVMLNAHRGTPVTALAGWTPPEPVDPLTRLWRRLTGG
ncbi:MAG: PBP1A family penicillin-binding protein [Rhodospirillaceae bacterium]|nr:PBP1A family penicillin-binding protein [Rhodospirillaceae bacterium]